MREAPADYLYYDYALLPIINYGEIFAGSETTPETTNAPTPTPTTTAQLVREVTPKWRISPTGQIRTEEAPAIVYTEAEENPILTFAKDNPFLILGGIAALAFLFRK